MGGAEDDLVCAQTTRCTEEITWVKMFVCAVLGDGISRERGEKEGASVANKLICG